MGVGVSDREINGTDSEGIVKESRIRLPDVSKMKPCSFEVEFKNDRVLLFSESSESFESSLYFVPLTHLFLKLKEHFNVLTDVKLEFPHIGLEFDSNSIFSEKISLVHVLALHKRLPTALPFFAVLTVGAYCFREKYDQLLNLPPNDEPDISDPTAIDPLESKNGVETESPITPLPEETVEVDDLKNEIKFEEIENQKREDTRLLDNANESLEEPLNAAEEVKTEVNKADDVVVVTEAENNDGLESAEVPQTFDTKGNESEFEHVNPDIQIEEIEQEDHQTNMPEVFPEEDEVVDEFGPETVEDPQTNDHTDPESTQQPLEEHPESDPQHLPLPEKQSAPELESDPQPQPQQQPELELEPEPEPEPTEALYDSETSQFSDIYVLYSDQEDLHDETYDPSREVQGDEKDNDQITESTESDIVEEARDANRKRPRDFITSTEEDTGNFNSYDALPPNKKPKLSFERFSTNDHELNQEESVHADPQGNEPVGNDGEEVVVSPEVEEELDIDIGQLNDDWPTQDFHLNLPLNPTSL
eukprot:TRINITY_DN228_c0_g1_i5.p1 TRINITY_DN228_c0_g1~~TRINITY_DN228_c0_g1_i5.p1  ORF type:complete len:568 (+),score=55.19 TRINITY_DN228_c0_g1_i5:111-1706(+)